MRVFKRVRKRQKLVQGQVIFVFVLLVSFSLLNEIVDITAFKKNNQFCATVLKTS